MVRATSVTLDELRTGAGRVVPRADELRGRQRAHVAPDGPGGIANPEPDLACSRDTVQFLQSMVERKFYALIGVSSTHFKVWELGTGNVSLLLKTETRVPGRMMEAQLLEKYGKR